VHAAKSDLAKDLVFTWIWVGCIHDGRLPQGPRESADYGLLPEVPPEVSDGVQGFAQGVLLAVEDAAL